MRTPSPLCLVVLGLSVGCGSARAGGDFRLDGGGDDRPLTERDAADSSVRDAPASPDSTSAEDLGVAPDDVPGSAVDAGARSCRSSRDCSDLALVCEPARGLCVECVAGNDCPGGQSCVANACRAMTCTPNTAVCIDARSSRRCLADGVTETVVQCNDRQTCGASGRCADLLCDPGALSCDAAGGRRACSADGLGFTPLPCPALPNAPTSRCAGGVCQPICAAGSADCDGAATDGCEASLQTDRAHCGRCGMACVGASACARGACEGGSMPTSCRAVQQANPGGVSGVFMLDPDGAGSAPGFQAWCEMTLAGGGWTLAAVITNADASHWSPRVPIWVDATTLGEASNPNTVGDAKSEAYNTVTADEIMIVRRGTTPSVEVLSTTGCLAGRSLRTVMQRNSSTGTACALSCTTVGTALSPWSGGTCQSTGLRFRCRDTSSTVTVGGFLVSSDDNSMITTSRVDGTSTCDATNFGLGSSTVDPGVADYDSDPTGTVVTTDRLARLVYVR